MKKARICPPRVGNHKVLPPQDASEYICPVEESSEKSSEESSGAFFEDIFGDILISTPKLRPGA